MPRSRRVLLDPGDPVWLEEPAYPGAVRAFAAAGARPGPVRVDQEGLDVNRGIKRCPDARVAVVTPSHQFPLGMTMSATRRVLLAAEIRKQLGPSFEVVTGNAGTYLVMLLPEGFRDTVVAEKAAQSDISTVPLSICYQEEPRKQGLILGYAGVNRKQIQDGMSKLAAILKV